MATSDALREVFTAARPLVEQWLDVAEQIAALREVATNKGLDWSQVKALLKAQIQDERDDAGEGKRVRRIVEKAEFASAYADMLGLSNMNEKKYSHDDRLIGAASEMRGGADTDTNPNFPDPRLSGAADGRRGIPSSDADGAKMQDCLASPAGQAAQAGCANIKSEQAVTNSSSALSSSMASETAGALTSSPDVPADQFDNIKRSHAHHDDRSAA